jgi:large exoprotein involved in heme utilization and adhesion
LNIISGGIVANSYGIGKGGDITINAHKARLIDGAAITSITFDKGETGYVKLNLIDQLHITGRLPFVYKTLGQTWDKTNSWIMSSSFGIGAGGRIEIQANNITVTDGGIINANSLTTGNAGNIFIQANNLQIMDNGQISSSAEHAVGGDISLTIPHFLYLQEGVITTSVDGGTGDGGNITISHPQLTVLNKGEIKAQADEGRGGNIRIVAEQFIKSPDSLISASSRLGLDGDVEVDAPEIILNDFLVVLPGGYIDASDQLPPPCTTARLAKNRFVVKRIAGSPPSPDDFQSNRLVLLPDEERASQKNLPRMTGAGAGQSAPKEAFKMMGCRPDLSEAKNQATPESRVIDEQLF